MDRLVKADVKEVNLSFSKGHKCSTTFRLTNLMHTMSVAVSLTSSNPSIFSFVQSLSIIPPLSTSSFTLLLSQPSDQPPLSSPLDTVLVRTCMLPTGKAHQDDLRRLFSRPGPHIFKDATIPISFVGPHVVEFLLSSSYKSLEIAFLLPKAISWCDKSQLTSLLRSAARKGNSHLVSALIEAGADVNGKESGSPSVMSLAVQSGNIDVVQLLIESGYIMENSADRLLHDAAAMNRVDLMEILCLGYVDIELNSVDDHGRTALHVAAINGHVEVLRFLVGVGSDPTVVDSNGWTPLHFASSEGHFEAVDFLLNNSTYVKYALTREGKTAFTIAVDKGYSNLYDLLHLNDVLHRAARLNDVTGMKSCIAEGAKVNSRDQNGWTPLHRAAFKGGLESIKLLLDQGAQIDLVDDAGYTAFHRAVEAGHLQVALYLVASGARANVKGLKGKVLSDLDCFKNHPSLVTSFRLEEEIA
ncbi:unnamed protein product [Ilex paraguariensis]|uniref:MSP domain-containing protein n=1 Tax=Ilex paraguariensis TaxID=185542 RepID=A0ABC8UDT2_9AQUA